MTTDCDFLVIGAGVSGAAAAWELAALGSTILLEMEDRPGYHSSGRSAALYTPNYGPALVREICQAAGSFFNAPPPGFAEHPLLTPRGALTLASTIPTVRSTACSRMRRQHIRSRKSRSSTRWSFAR